MKFLIDNWMLIAIALASGGMLIWPMIASGMNAGALSASGAVQLINREKAVVVDVSEAEEFAAGHVAAPKTCPSASWRKSCLQPSRTRPCRLSSSALRVPARTVPWLSQKNWGTSRPRHWAEAESLERRQPADRESLKPAHLAIL